jgi:hypothetical protein
MSTANIFWQIIDIFWQSHWIQILFILAIWIVFEIITRHGVVHYNSQNGFSPTFNRVVGSGTYLLLQAIVYAVLSFIFGDNIYIHVWPYAVHLIVFALTKLFLNLVGFWVY